MKKLFSFVMIAVLAIMVGGCQKYDDSELRKEIDGLKTRLAAVEALNNYKDLLQKLDNGKTVTGVSESNGVFTLTFDDNSSITFNQKGEPGAPGESITGPEGQPGVTPKFRINEETTSWEVSYDEGKTWTDAGSAMDRSLVSDVVVDNDKETLTITLADGSSIVVPFGSGMEAVDLGLSVRWATRNLGAKAPYQYGDYYSWGEIYPKAEGKYTTDYYKWYDKDTQKYTKYVVYERYGIVDNKEELEPEDDAAHMLLGGTWRIPSIAQMRELTNTMKNSNYKWTWKTVGGQHGVEITYLKNGNSIFLPAAGSTVNPDLTVGKYVSLWTSTLNPENYAANHTFLSEGSTFDIIRNGRAMGLPIRAVKE